MNFQLENSSLSHRSSNFLKQLTFASGTCTLSFLFGMHSPVPEYDNEAQNTLYKDGNLLGPGPPRCTVGSNLVRFFFCCYLFEV